MWGKPFLQKRFPPRPFPKNLEKTEKAIVAAAKARPRITSAEANFASARSFAPFAAAYSRRTLLRFVRIGNCNFFAKAPFQNGKNLL
jgi:hypothetical protein